MGKKMDEPEIKKECPSCGLGVTLEATICEFCGWDFDEEDEWILQIEKLERDLMQEKQKFEPGTVDDRIESTLHSPAAVKAEMIKSSAKSAPKPTPAETASPVHPETKIPLLVRVQTPTPNPAIREAPRPVQATQPQSATQPRVERSEPPVIGQKVRAAVNPSPVLKTEPRVQPASMNVPEPTREVNPAPVPSDKQVSSTKVRRIRTVRSAQGTVETGDSDSSKRLVRVVKVKKTG